MRMQLRRGVAVDRSTTVVLKGGRDPPTRGFRRMITADSRLHVPFGLVEGGRDTGTVDLADPIIATDERSERDAFRRGEGRIPGRAMRDGCDRLAVFVHVCARG